MVNRQNGQKEVKKYYVYALSKPDGTVFYVGKGLEKRVYEHVQEALRFKNWTDRQRKFYSANAQKCTKILEILASGGQVGVHILYETESESDALVFEWGMMFATCNAEHLTNSKNYRTGYCYPGARFYQQGIYRVWPKDSSGRRRKATDTASPEYDRLKTKERWKVEWAEKERFRRKSREADITKR